jgi:hypothetical protein
VFVGQTYPMRGDRLTEKIGIAYTGSE